jgi:hypothetical protein
VLDLAQLDLDASQYPRIIGLNMGTAVVDSFTDQTRGIAQDLLAGFLAAVLHLRWLAGYREPKGVYGLSGNSASVTCFRS